MHFTDIFIRRPVFASVLSLIILLVGLRAFSALSIREFPNIEPNVINVTTTYAGANAKLMEGFVTTPLENALAAVDGIDFIDSSSTQGQSDITIHFRLGYDINKAMSDVSNAVASTRSQLPQAVDSPIITKKDPSANPTIFMVFQSPTMSTEQITDYVGRVVEPQIQTIPGVGQARIFGEREYAMRLWLDPQRMAAQKITASDITQALQQNNVQAAPGLIETPYQELTVDAQTDLNTPEQFNNLVLRNSNGYLTRLKDVGYAALGAKDDQISIHISGVKNAIVLGVVPQPTANPLDVSKGVYKVLPNIENNLPAGLKGYVIYDSSKFISQSLKEVRKTIFEATICVALVILLFLGSLRAITIPLITIPLSLIGACSIMLVLGYTLNTLTLLAWVLAIGLVVDDSIVVLENIHRHIELGEKPVIAAINATREIGFAIIAMTFTLAAVYAPIGFLTDITGRLFSEFAFTLAGAVIVSGFIALTLSPMMSSKLLAHEIVKQGFIARVDEVFNNLMLRYKKLLPKVLVKNKLVVLLAVIVYLSYYLLYVTIPTELAPNEDQGYIIGFISAPTSANLNYTEKYTQELEKFFKTIPEIQGYVTINGIPDGVNSAISFLVLKPWNQRHRTAQQIIQALFPIFWGIPGVMAFPVNPAPLPGTSSRQPMEFVLKTISSYDNLNTAAQKLMAEMRKNPGLTNIDDDLKLDKPQVTITIDRNKASALGVSMMEIADSLNIMLGQPSPSEFNMQGRSYDVIPQLLAQYRNEPNQLSNINVRTASGDMIPLSNLATVTVGVAPKSLNHFQQLRAATIRASLVHGYTQGEALRFLETATKQTLPNYIQYDTAGQTRQFVDASGGMKNTFLFAVIFIFLILAAQFESFRDPLIVMVSVPLSLAGALLTLHLTGCTLNIYTQIGLVTLIGLISKHGILMVEFANKLQEKGQNKFEAIIEAASIRLRPILMTTGAMLLGALPLVLSSGAGAAARKQLGWTIFGGMAIGTALTLFIVPTFYTLIAKQKNKTVHIDNHAAKLP